MDAVIKLIKVTETKNSFCAIVKTETEREVLCSMESVSRSEFYAAAEAGLGATHTFKTHPANYEGETLVEYAGERFGINRVYQPDPDTLYIYTGEKVGAYGKRPDVSGE